MWVNQWIPWVCLSTKGIRLPKHQQPTVKYMLVSLLPFQKHNLRVNAWDASVQPFHYHISKTVKLLHCTHWRFSSFIRASYLYHNWSILRSYSTKFLNHASNTFDYKINNYKMSFCPPRIWKISCSVTSILNSFP